MYRSLGARLLLALSLWVVVAAGVARLLGAPLVPLVVMTGLVLAGGVALFAFAQQVVGTTAKQVEAMASPASAAVPPASPPAEFDAFFGALVDMRQQASVLQDSLEAERARQRKWTELFSRCMVALQSDTDMAPRFAALFAVLMDHGRVEAGGYFSLGEESQGPRQVAWTGALPAFPAHALSASPLARELEAGKISWVEDVSNPGAPAVLQEYCAHRGYRSVILVPGIWEDHTSGFLMLLAREPRPVEARLMSVLKSLRAPMGRAQHGAERFEQALSKQRQYRALYEMLMAVESSSDLSEAASRILEVAGELQPFHRAALLLADGQDAFAVFAPSRPGESGPFLGARLRREGSCAAHVLDSRSIRLDDDLERSVSFKEDRSLVEEGYHSRLVIPMLTSGRKPVGALYLVRRDERGFSKEVAEGLYQPLQSLGVLLASSRPSVEPSSPVAGVEGEPLGGEKLRRLSGLHHELRGQLRTLLDLANGMESDPRGAEVARRLRDLAAKLEVTPDPERPESDSESLHLEEVVVGDVIKDVLYNLHSLLKARRIKISMELPRELPAIVADPGHLRSALYHLLDLAGEMTAPGGRILVKAVFLPALVLKHKATEYMPADVADKFGTDVNVMLFSILDQGHVLSSEDRKKAFLEGQAPSGPEQPLLELHFVKRLVQLHRGQIWIEPGPEGRGNRVCMALPQYGIDQVSFINYVGRRLGKARESSSPLSLICVGLKERRSLRAVLGEARFYQAMKELEGAIMQAVREPIDAARRFHNGELVVVFAETDRAGAMRMVERMRSRLQSTTLPSLGRATDISTSVVCYPEDAVRAEEVIVRLEETSSQVA